MKTFSDDSDEATTKVEIKFLTYTCGYWDFPKNVANIEMIDAKFVFLGPCKPAETMLSGYKFNEDSLAMKMYKRIKHDNWYLFGVKYIFILRLALNLISGLSE